MEEERIGLFIDYENLAIGARDDLGIQFDFKPIADALAERGRVVVRRAYADWSSFDKDRQMLADNQVELIEIPQRRGRVRKNAADMRSSWRLSVTMSLPLSSARVIRISPRSSRSFASSTSGS